MIVHLLHIPSGSTYPVNVPIYKRFWNLKLKVDKVIKLAFAEDPKSCILKYKNTQITFTNEFEKFLFTCVSSIEEQPIKKFTSIRYEEFEII